MDTVSVVLSRAQATVLVDLIESYGDPEHGFSMDESLALDEAHTALAGRLDMQFPGWDIENKS